MNLIFMLIVSVVTVLSLKAPSERFWEEFCPDHQEHERCIWLEKYHGKSSGTSEKAEATEA